MKGFTLIEILLVVGILMILAILTLPITFDFYRSQQLNTHAQELTQTLRRAQLKAMSVESGSSFGVYLTDDNYTLFKGPSFASRDVQYDEVFDLPRIIAVSGIKEVVFSKFEGIPEENLAYCYGTCAPCSDFPDKKSCNRQDGCNWDRSKVCTGTCILCDSYGNQKDCEAQLGCSWPPVRGGDIILNSSGNYKVININGIGRVNLQ